MEFRIHTVDDHRVIVNITDPLTGLHESGKHFSIRDVLNKDLKYKISYYKSGSTGKVMCSAFFIQPSGETVEFNKTYLCIGIGGLVELPSFIYVSMGKQSILIFTGSHAH